MDTNPTKLPDMGTLQSGTMEASTRCFDLLCFGKCASENDLKLNIQSTGEPPNLITKNANGDIVFAEPTPMCTIQAPAGHNVWVNIELKTITTKASDYMCLGIKKRGEADYYDVLHSENLSRYVDVQEGDIVELVPLISATKLPTYTAVKAEDSARIIDENSYDFGSVYRVNVALNNERWVMNQSCNLYKIPHNKNWDNDKTIGIGQVEGKINELLAINLDGQLAHSSDGIHWFTLGSLIGENESTNSKWFGPIVYGNGIWCTINRDSTEGVKRSIDYGVTWSNTAKIGSGNLSFYNGIFMTITNGGLVYTSPDAEIWTQIGEAGAESDGGRLLLHDNNRWVYSTVRGHVYCSKDGRGNWEHIGDGLYNIQSNQWYGACYVNGYFYAIYQKGVIVRSSDGYDWKPVITFLSSDNYDNITYYKGRLFALKDDGTSGVIGLFRPDGTI